jgi:hypothetical protein
MQCFCSFHTAERTLDGIESMHMMRKGQVKRLDGRAVFYVVDPKASEVLK